MSFRYGPSCPRQLYPHLLSIHLLELVPLFGDQIHGSYTGSSYASGLKDIVRSGYLLGPGEVIILWDKE